MRKWERKAVKHPGRVTRYMKRKYGSKAFTKKGTIKMKYLQKAIKETTSTSLKRALILARTFKRQHK